MTEEGDIGFRLYYVKNRGGKKFDVVNMERVESHLVMEEGELLCTRPVLCKFQFVFFIILLVFSSYSLNDVMQISWNSTIVTVTCGPRTFGIALPSTFP